IGRDGKYTLVRLASSEVRRILSTCRGTVGQVGNIEHELVRVGKAGRSRRVGKRSSVRGFAMNSIDHTHGGGEGRSPVGCESTVSTWSKTTLGKKTRSLNKASNKFIIRERKRK